MTQLVIGLGVLLERAKEERAVAAVIYLGKHDGAAGAETAEELTVSRPLIERIIRRLAEAPVVHPRVGIEVLVPEVVESAAVEVVGSGLQGEIKYPARSVPVLRGHPAGLHAELLHSFHGRTAFANMTLDLRRRRDTVDQHVFAERRAAGDIGGPVVSLDCRGQRVCEILHRPASAERKGQVLDSLALHGGRDLRGVHLQQGSLARYGDALLHLAGVECDIDTERLADRDGQARAEEGFESCGCDSQLVFAEWDIRKGIESNLISGGARNDAGLRVGEDDPGVWNGGAARIEDRAGDGSAVRLRCCRVDAQQQRDSTTQ